jgi:hypothetical protein
MGVWARAWEGRAGCEPVWSGSGRAGAGGVGEGRGVGLGDYLDAGLPVAKSAPNPYTAVRLVEHNIN